MYKPNGIPADTICPLFLLNIWAHHLNGQSERAENDKPMIFAGLGKPTYFLNEEVTDSALQYWQQYRDSVARVKAELKTITNTENACDTIAQSGTAIDYGLPEGDPQAKSIMASALSRWYDQSITPQDIVFTVGGANALKMLFAIINARNKNGKIVTPIPYYPFYNNPVHNNTFHFIQLMEEPGYKLTAKVVEKSIESEQNISAFLFCDPNNPLGTIVGKSEWKKIANVLKNTAADIPIILDEAYAEMVFDRNNYASLLSVAPELKNRLIMLRSATKSLSASGERMGVVVCFNEQFRSELLDQIMSSYVHTPKSLQFAYAHAMHALSPDTVQELTHFYKLQAEYVQTRIKSMNTQPSDADYKTEGTFYVIAHLKDLLGSDIPQEAEMALGKSGKIETDADICYSLLFDDHVMIAPLSFFGVDPRLGYVRITCSNGFSQLKDMMDRIETRLAQARGFC